MNINATQHRLHTIFDGKSPVTGADRAYALTLTGHTQRDVARACGVTGPSTHEILFDKATSYNIASKVAELTGLPLNRLWPDGRYSKGPKEGRRAA